MTDRDLKALSRAALGPLLEPMAVPKERDPLADPMSATRQRDLVQLSSLITALPAKRAMHQTRRRAARWMGALAAAAVVALGIRQWGGGASAQQEQASNAAGNSVGNSTLMAGQLRTASGRALSAGAAFDSDEELVTPEDRSALVLTKIGAQVTFAPHTRAAFQGGPGASEVLLRAGQVSLDVPPLPSGNTLSVRTGDALVTVHGTRFSVAVEGAPEVPRTCVRVSEGTVSVRRGAVQVEMLGVGQTSGCESSPGAALPPETALPLETALPGAEPPLEPTQRERARVRPTAPKSTLAAQNRLMREGLAAEQSGDFSRASERLRELITRYPDSPLLDEARRALKRITAARESQQAE